MRFHTLFICLTFLLPAPLFAAGEIALFTIDVKLRGTGLEQIQVHIECDRDKPFLLTIAVNVDDSRTITVPVPDNGAMTCRLWTDDLPGHELKFVGDGGSQFDYDTREVCQFNGVKRGHANFCQIEIESQDTSLTVFKRWVGTSEPEKDVTAFLECSDGKRLKPARVNTGQPAVWHLEVHLNEGVICQVSEAESDSYTPDTSDCEDLLILPGATEECTVVNTKVVKMIEALNRYGLVIMILVFMAVGGFAVRRLV